MTKPVTSPEGLPIYYWGHVQSDWIDYNGHLNDGYYAVVFGLASEAVLQAWDLHNDYRLRTGCTVYTVEAHITYQRELKEGAAIHAVSRLLAVDEKRIHLFHELMDTQAGSRVATCELLFLHVDQRILGAVPMPADRLQTLQTFLAQSAHLLPPAEVGARVQFRRKSTPSES